MTKGRRNDERDDGRHQSARFPGRSGGDDDVAAGGLGVRCGLGNGHVLIFCNLHHTVRIGKCAVADEAVLWHEPPDATFKGVAELVSGAYNCLMLVAGDLRAGFFYAGQMQRLVHAVPACKDLIDGVIRLERASWTLARASFSCSRVDGHRIVGRAGDQ